MRFHVRICGMLLACSIVGCADKVSAPDAEKTNGAAKSSQTGDGQSTPNGPASNDGGPKLIGPGVNAPSDDAQPTHVVSIAAEFYTTGPQQGRPPDGKFEAGTKVALIESAGSYSRVRSTTGVEAYVANDALKPLNRQSDDGTASDAK